MELLTRIQENWIVLLIPVISALVGWITNVVAVKMMFYPVEFIGIKPYLGWQGVVPANAMRLAKTANELIVGNLITLRELFDTTFSPEALAEKLKPATKQISDQIIAEVAETRAKAMWDNAGEFMQNKIREQVETEVQTAITAITNEMADNIDDILSLEDTVLQAVDRSKQLMGEMFYAVGKQEFKWVERSGLYFGFLFGVIQMLIWVEYPAWWILPAAGFFVGYATNWIAIKMVFHPQKPVKIGPFTIQGLFHKRQKEVSAAFGEIVATRVLTADNIVESVMGGPGREQLTGIISQHISQLIHKYEQHPMADMLVPAAERTQIRSQLLERIEAELPKQGGFFHTFAGHAVDLRGELERRMSALDSETYEGILRPAFQTDEWKLIALGAVLGTGAGFAQLVFIFGDAMKRLSQ